VRSGRVVVGRRRHGRLRRVEGRGEDLIRLTLIVREANVSVTVLRGSFVVHLSLTGSASSFSIAELRTYLCELEEIRKLT